MLGVVLLLVVGLSMPAMAWKPPSGHTPPIFTYQSIVCSYTSGGVPIENPSVVASCKVTWDSHAFQRYVWLYVDGNRYTMSYNPSTQTYSKSVSVHSTAHTVYIKARQIIDFEYISQETRTGNYNFAPPADQVGNSYTNARSLGTLTSQGTVSFSYEWIEPSSDYDWFKLYTGIGGLLTIDAHVQNPTLDIMFTYYDGYPGDFPPPFPYSTDSNGQGEDELAENLFPPMSYGWVYIKVKLGSQGGCGAYEIDVTYDEFS